MSLVLALNTALTGLSINQQALSVLSQNIANVNTPGYSRKILNQEAQSLGGRGAGVRLADVSRRVDEYLSQAVRLQTSIVGRADIANEYADRVQLMLGSPASGNSINAHVTNFFNALQTLAQTPEDATFKAGVVQGGSTLAQQFAQLANGLQELRYQADQDIFSATSVINSSLRQIYDLNIAIAENIALGRPATELLDERDTHLAEVAQYMDIQTFTRANGTINVSTNGVSLLDDSVYKLVYTPSTSPAALINDNALSAIQVYRSNETGDLLGSPTQLTTEGTSDQVGSVITSGKIKGLLEQRDRELPRMLAQLDILAYNLQDQINAAHNAGIAFPGATSYTGSHAVGPQDYSDWTGNVRIAVLGQDGQPVTSSYSNLPGGVPPLNIDLSTLNGGFGAGKPTVQSIINEINQYYGVPQNKLTLGDLTNIRLASNSTRLPGSPPTFSFDLDLENLSANSASVFVTSVEVLDDTDADITSLTETVPSTALATSGTFETTSGSNVITINSAAAHGFSDGDTIFLPDITTAIAPSTDIGGIPLSELNDTFFTISNATATSFQITAVSNASSTGTTDATGATVLPPYTEITAGESRRTTADGVITSSLSGNSTSAYYTVNVNVSVEDENGAIVSSVVTYRVDNNQNNLINNRYAVRSATGQGTVLPPGSTQSFARAILVDADGNALPTTNGQYASDQQGFLKLVTSNSSYVLAIDSLDSVELGDENATIPVAATNRGFSHFFGLNNFFVDNDAPDPITNSALNLAVMQRLVDDPGLVSTGSLTLISPDNAASANYTYERTVGDQSAITQLADLGLANVLFAAAGGLGATTQTFGGYSAQIISAAATGAAAADSNAKNAQLLVDGYTQRSNAISGVNLDEELANTVIYQNAYSASARMITVADELFETLLQAF